MKYLELEVEPLPLELVDDDEDDEEEFDPTVELGVELDILEYE